MRDKPKVVDARFQAARARARRAASGRLHPRLSPRSNSNGAHRVRNRAEIFRRRAGDPRDQPASRSPAAASMSSVKDLQRVNNGLGISILSTPKGVMSDHDARDANVGGEVLCTVF